MDSNIKILFDSVSVGYNEQEPILETISFSVSAGELVYLIGRTASGKSTLLKTMYAEIPLLSGGLQISDFNISQIKRSQVPYLRRKLAVVFQDFQLLGDRSVYDNLLFVLKATGWKKKAEIDARIKEVLDHVGIVNKEHKMPHQLSGGEQQRVVVARALLNKPEVILADEPTGHLDPETSEVIFSLLHQIAKNGCAVFFVTHNYQMLKKYPARTLKCENNTILETDEEKELIDFEQIMME